MLAEKASMIGAQKETVGMAKVVGFLELGRSYAQSADFLRDALCSKQIDLARLEPIDFLYAHAFELVLKACLLENDPELDVADYGHDLLRLYDEVKSQKLLGHLIQHVETAVRDRWKCYLRDARDNYEDLLGLGEATTEERSELGIYENDVIDQNLPELRKQIDWLGSRHKADGGTFRYLRPGLDSREFIQAFSLSENVVYLSSSWALEELYGRFRQNRSA